MTDDLNDVLWHLNTLSRRGAKSKANLLEKLNLPLPRLNSVIKKLNREGYVHIFMRSSTNHKELEREDWENTIIIKLSRRGKAFLKEGAYQKTVHHIDPMKSVVGF